MTELPPDRAGELRRAFDQAFAEPPRAQAETPLDVLGIRVAGDAYAVRLSELTGVFADRAITRVPSPLPELLGIAGFRGSIVPVYSLRGLLGYPPGHAPRWLLLAGSGDPVALAFDELDGCLRVLPADIVPAAGQERARAHVRDAVRTAEALRPMLGIASLMEAITRRARPSGPSKEP